MRQKIFIEKEQSRHFPYRCVSNRTARHLTKQCMPGDCLRQALYSSLDRTAVAFGLCVVSLKHLDRPIFGFGRLRDRASLEGYLVCRQRVQPPHGADSLLLHAMAFRLGCRSIPVAVAVDDTPFTLFAQLTQYTRMIIICTNLDRSFDRRFRFFLP